jgi:RNA polymerase sigma factor for flagellar operon FliA
VTESAARAPLSDAEHALVTEGLPEVDAALARLGFRWRRFLSRDEARSHAHEGLLAAARSHDKTRGSFRVFARFRIEYAVLDALRDSDRHNRLEWAVRGAARRSAALDGVMEADGEAFGRSEVEDRERLSALTMTRAAIMLVRLAEEARQLQDEDAALARIALARVEQALSGALADLPERQRALVDGHYAKERELFDVAKDLGISKATAKRDHQKALENLRQGLQARGVLGGVSHV